MPSVSTSDAAQALNVFGPLPNVEMLKVPPGCPTSPRATIASIMDPSGFLTFLYVHGPGSGAKSVGLGAFAAVFAGAATVGDVTLPVVPGGRLHAVMPTSDNAIALAARTRFNGYFPFQISSRLWSPYDCCEPGNVVGT